MDKNTSVEKFDGRIDHRPAKFYNLDVRTDSKNEIVWLTQKEMSLLFDISVDNIGLHIRNILKENELDESTAEESSVVQLEGDRKVTRQIKVYNLDMAISV